jgi:hypothetical protein
MRIDIMERANEFIFLCIQKSPCGLTARAKLLFSSLFNVAASGGK